MLAQPAGISELDILPFDEPLATWRNGGYITRDRLLRDHLRNQQQRISYLVAGSVATSRDISFH
jgi:hypothetical protein